MNMQISSLLFLGLSILGVNSYSEALPMISMDNHLRESISQALPVENTIPANLTAGTFQQSIDHFGDLPNQTFAQRFWIDSEFATSANAPVIYHICGEGDATQGYFLKDNAIAWAKTLGARLVYLEHRYYGQSLPFSDLSSDHLKYLTLNNEMQDLATFQKSISASQGWTGKWISVGGSYSGTLSALYRFLHPDMVVGALASSAPMISGVGSADDDGEASGDLTSTDPSSDTGSRQWAYQGCTTFGFWEAQGMSLFFPSASLCQQLFGNVSGVNPTSYNQTYDAPFLSDAANSPSNILFTYGSDDVWTKIGLSTQKNVNPKIKIQIISGAVHHYDLNYPSAMDSAAVKSARAEFITLATQWLK
jgi:pimeloyl-ACP methyl ester carboxylesterase